MLWPRARRPRFQTGQAKVRVVTTVASISLNAYETLEGGRQATGHTHRNLQVSLWHITYAHDTVEAQVSKVTVERIPAASDTVGGDTAGLIDVAQLLGAAW